VSPTEATLPQMPHSSRTLRKTTQTPRATAKFFIPTAEGRSTHRSAPETQKSKVGAASNVIDISQDEFQLLKFELEETQRTLSQKQNELDHEKTRSITHR